MLTLIEHGTESELENRNGRAAIFCSLTKKLLAKKWRFNKENVVPNSYEIFEPFYILPKTQAAISKLAYTTIPGADNLDSLDDKMVVYFIGKDWSIENALKGTTEEYEYELAIDSVNGNKKYISSYQKEIENLNIRIDKLNKENDIICEKYSVSHDC